MRRRRNKQMPDADIRKPRRSLAAAAVFVGFALFSLGTIFASMGTPETAPLPSVVAAVDAQRIELPTGPAFVLTLGVMASADEAAMLPFHNGQQYDFAIRGDGREIWRWSTGRAFHQALHERVLPAGELITFVHVWDGRDANGNPVFGEIEVVGFVTARTPIETAPVALYVDEWGDVEE